MSDFTVRMFIEIVVQPLSLTKDQKIIIKGLFAHANFYRGLVQSQLFVVSLKSGLKTTIINVAPEAHFDDNILK